MQKAQVVSKLYYDRRARERELQVGDLVYLHNTVRKKHQSKKFWTPWNEKFKIIGKKGKLNYRIVNTREKSSCACEPFDKGERTNEWEARQREEGSKPGSRQGGKKRGETGEISEEEDVRVPGNVRVPAGLAEVRQPAPRTPGGAGRAVDEPDTIPTGDETRDARHRDPSFAPSDSPRSRYALRSTRDAPPVTRARGRLQSRLNEAGQEMQAPPEQELGIVGQDRADVSAPVIMTQLGVCDVSHMMRQGNAFLA
jgi:hypothetical protein